MASELVSAAAAQGQSAETPRRSNLPSRLFAAVIFLPCLYLITLHGDWQFLFMVYLIVFTGLFEFYGLLEGKGFQPLKLVGLACGLAICWYAYFRGGAYSNFLLALALLAMMTIELTRRTVEQAVMHISSTVFGVLYVGWLGSHFVLLRELPRVAGLDYAMGAKFVFFAILVTWSGDTGAYFVGKAWGRRPLMPRVSPRKTVEGAVGGVACSLLAGFIAQQTFAGYLSTTMAVGMALVASVAGMTGDLVESLIKRDSQIKDTAKLIPGHGGTLDRFDSLLFSVPLLYYLHKFFVI